MQWHGWTGEHSCNLQCSSVDLLISGSRIWFFCNYDCSFQKQSEMFPHIFCLWQIPALSWNLNVSHLWSCWVSNKTSPPVRPDFHLEFPKQFLCCWSGDIFMDKNSLCLSLPQLQLSIFSFALESWLAVYIIFQHGWISSGSVLFCSLHHVNVSLIIELFKIKIDSDTVF